MERHEYDRFREDADLFLQSKAEEFALLGYGKVERDELWQFLKKKKWRKAIPNKAFCEIVEDIMSVKPGDYMNYVSVEQLKTTEFSLDDADELKELLK